MGRGGEEGRRTAVDDDAAEDGAVPADPFGRAMGDDVRAVVEGADEVASHAEGVVNEQWDTVVVGQLRELGERGDGVLRVADALHVDRLRVLVDSRRKLLRCLAVHEFDSNVELLQENCRCIHQVGLSGVYTGEMTNL